MWLLTAFQEERRLKTVQHNHFCSKIRLVEQVRELVQNDSYFQHLRTKWDAGI